MSKPNEIYGRYWSEPEYIIVLHEYIRNRGKPRHHLCDYVLQTANLLGRTPGAVVMRMENYASLDPDENATRKGLVNITEVGARIFREWSGKPEALHACAEVLIREIERANRPSLFEPEPVRVPRAFGKYELLDPLGEGSFGSVFSCIHTETQQLYAIKIMKTQTVQNPDEVLGRCRREIKGLKAVQHPNIIRIFEDNLDEQRDFPGFVMELAETSLSQHIEQSGRAAGQPRPRPALPLPEAVLILDAVLSAALAMHSAVPTLIHRDINPNNILRAPGGRWVLADFSLAKFLQVPSLTTTFATTRHGWGTAHFMAPEQWEDFALADQRADVYSLGMLIWELISSSRPPFERTHLGLPDTLTPVVEKATARDPIWRYQSVLELAAAAKDGWKALLPPGH